MVPLGFASELRGAGRTEVSKGAANFIGLRLERSAGMSNFKKLSDALQFAPEKMKKNGIFETERFFCDTYCFEPGQTQSPHTHAREDKIYYVIEGRGMFTVGEEERELGPGEIALAPAGQNHGVVNRSQQRLVTLVFVTPKPHR
jgi:quercetin dioxygenase-like cupin family protein